MEWYIIASIIGLVIGIVIIVKRRNGEEDIFSRASNGISSLGKCCTKLFGRGGA